MNVQDRIAAAQEALKEYRAQGEDGLAAICQQRIDELLDTIPQQREGD